MNKKQLRHSQILDLLKEKKFLTVTALSLHFKVSEETIRQDLYYLENSGLILKYHGGAKINELPELESLGARLEKNYEKKIAICRSALEEINIDKHPTLGIDRGTTLQLLANQLSFQKNHKIVTNSLAVINEFKNSKNEIYCPGGKFSAKEQSFFLTSYKELEPLQIDILFLGSSGTLGHQGICSDSFPDRVDKGALINISRKKIALVDATKFSRTSFVEVAPWKDLDLLITDSSIEPHILKNLSTTIKVKVAKL